MKNIKENKLYELIIILICILILLPLFIISIYNRPSADDYDYAILTHQAVENGGGVWEIIKAAWKTNINFYNEWQGLYTSAFILAFQPGILGTNFYALTTFIVTGIAFVCLLISVQILNKYFMKKSFLYSVTVSTVILTVILIWLPSATEGLYWYNGAMNYMPFAFLTILNTCLVFDAVNTIHTVKGKITLIVSIILSFVISGGNHVTSFANILILIIAFLICSKKLSFKKALIIFIPLVSACIGFYIMYRAPGTSVRQSRYEQNGVIDTIFMTIGYLTFRITKDWCSLPWLISLVLITPTAIEFSQKNKEKFSKKFPFLIILFSIIVISGMCCVPYFSIGSFGAGRLTNVVWIFFLISTWIIYFLIWMWIANKNIIKIENIYIKENFYIIYIICIFLLFMIPKQYQESNSLIALKELYNNTAYNYSIQIDERIKLYEDKNTKEVEVPPLKTISEILFFDDIGTNPNIWPNTSISRYYNKIIYIVE